MCLSNLEYYLTENLPRTTDFVLFRDLPLASLKKVAGFQPGLLGLHAVVRSALRCETPIRIQSCYFHAFFPLN